MLVVGGGPAGSTAAALLTERGWRVVLVEKDKHPRFHIGESLLPLNLGLLEKLGILKEIERIGMPKYGAEFISPEHDGTVTYDFANGWSKEFTHAYQVRRSVFDDILLRNAARKGAAVIEECLVEAVAFPDEGGVVAEGRDRAGKGYRWRARFLVDASGRETLLAGKLGLKRRNRKHSSAAIFGHFANAERLPGKAQGNISIFWFDHGWFWFIPLSDGTTSVGAVCWPAYMKTRRTDLTSFFHDTIAKCPAIAARLRNAQLTAEVTATGNYSYRATRMTGERYILVGDAFAFIDPVFSTGVYLAMNSAFHGAEAVDTCLREPKRAAAALRRFETSVRRGIDTFSWYIYRATAPAFRRMFMAPNNKFRVVEAQVSLLAGDVFGESPIGPRLVFFKIVYYLTSLFMLKTSVRTWRARGG
ncbi:MAG: tryptophan 7-halogenase [Alphaproteobacteria bacterium]|nr:tryptophan 7-halogenase [Alphaproteobacteria bacterium]